MMIEREEGERRTNGIGRARERERVEKKRDDVHKRGKKEKKKKKERMKRTMAWYGVLAVSKQDTRILSCVKGPEGIAVPVVGG